ncbi:MAG: Mg/Co transporter-like protein [Verrucomicrobiales bacterium]|nr:Mg/Co transporter-like protein [Verrucomicrobiales bacterium]
MSNTDIITLIALIFCVALSFLFSGMESGVLALNRFRIRHLMRSGNKRAAVLNHYLDNPEDFLWTILVGNTVANIAVFSIGVLELFYWLGAYRVWWTVAFIGFVFVFYIVCELLPKTLFQRFPNRLALVLAPPFRLFHLALSPLVAIAAWFSSGLLRLTGGRAFTGRLFGNREELRLVMQESAQSLTSEERVMLNRVLDLQNVRVRNITVPFSEVVSVTDVTPMSAVVNLCRERNLTRMPVLRADNNRVIGTMDMDAVLYREDLDVQKPASAYVRGALFLPEDLLLEEAMRRMQRTGDRLAIVLDREQRERGIVSLQDILKVIFGEVTL